MAPAEESERADFRESRSGFRPGRASEPFPPEHQALLEPRGEREHVRITMCDRHESSGTARALPRRNRHRGMGATRRAFGSLPATSAPRHATPASPAPEEAERDSERATDAARGVEKRQRGPPRATGAAARRSNAAALDMRAQPRITESDEHHDEHEVGAPRIRRAAQARPPTREPLPRPRSRRPADCGPERAEVEAREKQPRPVDRRSGGTRPDERPAPSPVRFAASTRSTSPQHKRSTAPGA